MSIFSRIAALFGYEPEAPADTSSAINPDVARKLLEFKKSQQKLAEDQYRHVNLMEDPEDD